jgi:hypothetical protein
MRFRDWQERLDQAIDAARNQSFSYGSFDCALFAASCVEAMTGVDYAAELRGYDSRIDAYRIVAKFGSLEAMITSLLQREPMHPSRATIGDVVLASVDLAPGESGDCIGVCTGVRFRAPTEKGLAAFSMSAARLAWRIE